MGQIRLTGNPPVDILLRPSARARRLSLRVSKLDGRVTLTMPRNVSEREARRFAEDKAEWIQTAIGRQDTPVEVRPGATVPVEGVERKVVAGAGRSARLLPESLVVPDKGAGPAAAALMKLLARDRLVVAVSRHARAAAQSFGKITLRDTRSRWGSCTTDGNLMFSWRLILAPAQVLDYVAAHEVAHLVHMDHSRAFWNVVGELCPGYPEPRDWLRQVGHGLHRYRF